MFEKSFSPFPTYKHLDQANILQHSQLVLDGGLVSDQRSLADDPKTKTYCGSLVREGLWFFVTYMEPGL